MLVDGADNGLRALFVPAYRCVPKYRACKCGIADESSDRQLQFGEDSRVSGIQD